MSALASWTRVHATYRVPSNETRPAEVPNWSSARSRTRQPVRSLVVGWGSGNVVGWAEMSVETVCGGRRRWWSNPPRASGRPRRRPASPRWSRCWVPAWRLSRPTSLPGPARGRVDAPERVVKLAQQDDRRDRGGRPERGPTPGTTTQTAPPTTDDVVGRGTAAVGHGRRPPTAATERSRLTEPPSVTEGRSGRTTKSARSRDDCRAASAREVWLLTVPGEMSRTAAVSSTDRSA